MPPAPSITTRRAGYLVRDADGVAIKFSCGVPCQSADNTATIFPTNRGGDLAQGEREAHFAIKAHGLRGARVEPTVQHVCKQMELELTLVGLHPTLIHQVRRAA